MILQQGILCVDTAQVQIARLYILMFFLIIMTFRKNSFIICCVTTYWEKLSGKLKLYTVHKVKYLTTPVKKIGIGHRDAFIRQHAEA